MDLGLPNSLKPQADLTTANSHPLKTARRTGKRSPATGQIAFLTAAGILMLLLSHNQPRAGEVVEPEEPAAPLPQRPGAAGQRPITLIGVPRANALGKPCLAYDTYSRPRASNVNIFDYLVSIRNQCPQSIKVRICHTGSSDCSLVAVHSYQHRETVMGSGPKALRFSYTAKENP